MWQAANPEVVYREFRWSNGDEFCVEELCPGKYIVSLAESVEIFGKARRFYPTPGMEITPNSDPGITIGFEITSNNVQLEPQWLYAGLLPRQPGDFGHRDYSIVDTIEHVNAFVALGRCLAGIPGGNIMACLPLIQIVLTEAIKRNMGEDFGFAVDTLWLAKGIGSRERVALEAATYLTQLIANAPEVGGNLSRFLNGTLFTERWDFRTTYSPCDGSPYEVGETRIDFSKSILPLHHRRTEDTTVITAHSPVTLLVLDSFGRRTGLPPGGSVLQEIPGSVYGGPSADPQSITFPTAMEYYSLVVYGVGNGSYSLDVQYSGALGDYDVLNAFSGTVVQGDVNAFIVRPNRPNDLSPGIERQAVFVRGDSTGDGQIDLSDAIRVLKVLFLGEGSMECLDAGDANDDGGLDIADAVFTLGYLYLGTAPPHYPGPSSCGADITLDYLVECGYSPTNC